MVAATVVFFCKHLTLARPCSQALFRDDPEIFRHVPGRKRLRPQFVRTRISGSKRRRAIQTFHTGLRALRPRPMSELRAARPQPSAPSPPRLVVGRSSCRPPLVAPSLPNPQERLFCRAAAGRNLEAQHVAFRALPLDRRLQRRLSRPVAQVARALEQGANLRGIHGRPLSRSLTVTRTTRQPSRFPSPTSQRKSHFLATSPPESVFASLAPSAAFPLFCFHPCLTTR